MQSSNHNKRKKNTYKIVMTVLLAAIFAIVAIIFEKFVVIPHITEIRPASLFTVGFGLMFGPVGALACAVGNLIGDMFGTLTMASIGGFIGNYAAAYIPYKLWYVFLRKDDEYVFKIKKFGDFCFLILFMIISSASCAVIIPVFADIFGLAPFNVSAPIIFLNNILLQATLGTVLYVLMIKIKPLMSQIQKNFESKNTVSINRSRLASILLIVVAVIDIVLTICFGILFPKTMGQLVILIPMSILSLIIIVLMKL